MQLLRDEMWLTVFDGSSRAVNISLLSVLSEDIGALFCKWDLRDQSSLKVTNYLEDWGWGQQIPPLDSSLQRMWSWLWQEQGEWSVQVESKDSFREAKNYCLQNICIRPKSHRSGWASHGLCLQRCHLQSEWEWFQQRWEWPQGWRQSPRPLSDTSWRLVPSVVISATRAQEANYFCFVFSIFTGVSQIFFSKRAKNYVLT